jgi:adenylate cyclase
MARLECWKISNIELGGPSLETGIGLHYGSVISGVLESGYHDELTVIGDTVNVAQRLETLTKKLEAPLVVSITMMGQVPGAEAALNWVRKDEVALAGRRELIDIAYVRRAAPAARLQEAS